MSDSVSVELTGSKRIMDRLMEMRKNTGPTSDKVRIAITRAAMLITNQAKINVRRHGLVDTGRLINSLRWEFYRDGDIQGIRIGSFGVPYAHIWEGLLVPNPPLTPFPARMPIRAHQRVITQAFGRQIPAKSVSVRAHYRNIIAKPYLRPAYERHKQRVTQILLEAI